VAFGEMGINRFITEVGRGRTLKRKIGRLQWLTIGVVVIISTALASVPTKEAFDKFIAKKHGIQCTIDAMNFGESCTKDGEPVDFKSSHFRRAFLYASFEQDYVQNNGDPITIRTLGVFGMLFEMRDGFWWERVFH
jgi:hypothetical protein